MGQLIAKRYRTSMMAYLADHTYVECGAGKAWGCFGGSKNGEAISAGEGSTARANAIAEPNGEAGVGRYLIDGVCHQAANRILLPANRLVTEARGYWLSVSIFGTYGRSAFNMRPDVMGDLEACVSRKPQRRSELEIFLLARCVSFAQIEPQWQDSISKRLHQNWRHSMSTVL